MAPYIGYDSDTTFIPGTLNTSSSLTIQGGGITQTGGDVNLDSGTLFIDEDLNRVGIGTSAPTTKLDVFVNGGEGLPTVVTGERMRVISNDVVSRSGYLSIIAGSSAYSGVFFGNKDSADIGKIRYYHADNSLQFFVNGTTEGLRINSTGNVGVGSTNPNFKLDVVGTFRATGESRFDNGINLKTATLNYVYFDDAIAFSRNGVGERVRINSSGNVGIGTTNPGYTLDVQGSQNVTTQISLWGRTIGQPQTLIEPGRIYATSAGLGPGNLLLQPTGGNIGIGTDSPSENLHVHAPGGDLAAIVLSGTATLQIPYQVRQGINGVSNAGFSIYDITAASTRFAIDSAGNVGIGTGNPLSKLHVDGTSRLISDSSAPAATVSPIHYIASGNSSDSVVLEVRQGRFNKDVLVVSSNQALNANLIRAHDNGTDRFIVTGAGNVGIGTTNPSTKLYIRQSADFDGITLTHAARAGIWKIYHSGTSSENIAFVQNDGTSDAVSYVAGRDLHNWYTGGTSKMVITSAGSVGVGTDDPVGKLSVSGGSGSRLLNVAEGSTARFLINGSTSSTDPGNAVFYTGVGFDASHYMVLQNNTDAYGRVGLVIRGKTFNGANTPSTNDGWNVASPRSGIRFEAYLSGDTGFDSKFAIQHLLTAGTNNSIGDLGFLAKGYSTTFPAVVLTAAGNVGIGSANPATKFVVVGSNTVAKIESSTNYVDLQLANSQSSSGYIQYFEGNLRFFANSGSVPTMTITGGSPGNVGIGITNPSDKLHVNGSIRAISYGSLGNYSALLGQIRVGADEYGNTIKVVNDTNLNIVANNNIYFNTGAATDGSTSGSFVGYFGPNGLYLASGKGIDFGATANGPGTASEVLSDYEEGTWTPTFTASVNCSSISLNGTAWYIKIGKLVSYSFVANLQVTTASTKTALLFTLPFAQTNFLDRQGGNAALEGPAGSGYPIASGTIVDASSGTSDAYAAWGSSAVNFNGSVTGYFSGSFRSE